MMNKRLLVLGAGRGQADLIKTAEAMGITVIVATMNDNKKHPGIPLADEVCYVDISNSEAVCRKATELNLTGVATACLDTGIGALGAVCDRFKLSGLSANAAGMCNNKYLMKRALIGAGVNTARFMRVDNDEQFREAVAMFSFPFVIKAVDLQGSRGIYIVRNEVEAYDRYRQVLTFSKQDYCIIEEFIEGEEFGAEAFVYNDEVIFVLPHGKVTFMSHTGVPIGHYAPYNVDDAIINETQRTVAAAIHALGLNNCAVNADLFLKDGKVYVIELTGRVGANCLPELVSIFYGIDYYKMIILCALGEDPRLIFEARSKVQTANLSNMLRSDKAGILKEIINNNLPDDDMIYNMTFFVKPGDEIRAFTNSNDCLGQVIVYGGTLDDCQRKMDAVVNNTSFILK